MSGRGFPQLHQSFVDYILSPSVQLKDLRWSLEPSQGREPRNAITPLPRLSAEGIAHASETR